MWIFSAQESFAGECLKDSRKVELQGNVLRMRDYFCRIDGGQVRVQFQRVNDYAMGGIVSNKMPPMLEPIFGNGRWVENDTYREWQTLVKRFGSATSEQENVNNFSAFAADGQNAQGHLSLEKNAAISVLARWQHLDFDASDFPLALSSISALARSNVPKGFQTARVPGATSDDNLYWRYMTYDDLRNYSRNLRAWNRAIARIIRQLDAPSFGEIQEELYIELLGYLGKKGWPKRFVPINVSIDWCGGYWMTKVYRHVPLVDIAIIENTGTLPIEISTLLVSPSNSHALRLQSSSRALRARSPQEMSLDNRTLGPGERILVPTRITFATADLLRRKYANMTGGPKVDNYVYGPEIALKGFVVEGKRLELEGKSSNFLALTTSTWDGSCPYLYSWDKTKQKWRKHGKVIHKARGRSKKETETVSFDGLISRYRLAEEEAELAYIDHVDLHLNLKDGSSISIKPQIAELKATDKRYINIFFGETLDIDFPVPDWIDPKQVIKSHITIVGYYRRYSEIMKTARKPVESLRKAELIQDSTHKGFEKIKVRNMCTN